MKNKILTYSKLFIFITLMLIFFSGFCSGQEKDAALGKNKILTNLEKKEGWQLLFDGKTFTGWRGLGRETVPESQWKIDDGAIRNLGEESNKTSDGGQPFDGGDLMTVKTFYNFELYFEWKIPKAGNSGVKYNVSEELSIKYASKYSALGFEYQLLDDNDETYKDLDSLHMTGALYDMIPARHKSLNPIGKYNISRILIDGNHVEHWLNGDKVLEYEFGSRQLDSLFKKSKFKNYPDFIGKKKGHIVLQNHTDDAWFRNIKIKELKTKTE